MSSPTTLPAVERELIDCYLGRRPFVAAQLGVGSGYRLPSVSGDAEADLAARVRRLREELSAVRAQGLSREDRLTVDLMEEVSGYELASLGAHPARYVVTPLPEAGLASAILLFFPNASVSSLAEVEEFETTCRTIPQVLDDQVSELAVGRNAGQHPVGHLVRRAIEQIEQYLVSDLEEDPFVAAGDGLGQPGGSVRRGLAATIRQEVRPAFERYVASLREDVLPSARSVERPGMAWLPGGEAIYRDAVREHTTLPLDPAHLHELGRELIEQLHHEVARIGAALGWSPSFPWIRDRLRGDRSLYFSTADQMLDAADRALRRAEEQVPRWISDVPSARCEVRAMSPLEVRNGVLGHYQTAPLDRQRPGRYWLNTSRPGTRPIYEAEVLAHHESVPGHHIEMATSQETVSSSPFRRLVEITPYREGWALYMERFADEMGLYSSELDRLGMLSFELWRAGRLVVDTGMHLYGWSRQRAVDFLWDSTVLTRANVENEVDRYIACPGQALGYMVGRLAISQLRSALVMDSSSPSAHRSFFGQLLANGPLTLGCLARALGVELSI